jgi:Protein of unknown function (DUF1236)
LIDMGSGAKSQGDYRMNTKRLIMTAAAIALIAGTTGAFAQQEPGGRGAPNVAPGAVHQGAGAVPGGAATRNDGAENSRRNSAEQRGEPGSQNRTGQVQQNRGRGETTGQAAPRRERQQNRATEERGRDTERNRLSTHRENESRGQNRATEDRGNSPRTTGQGAAAGRGAVNISPEQRTRLHAVFAGERNAPRVNEVDFDLAVGRPVPRSVHFVPVPQAIFAIEPAWRGYDYFMVGDQIVIVDPRSMEIVAILEA